MIFKHYCAVFFNPTDGLNEEISKVCEDAPRAMKGKGISIYTFTSIVETAILTDYFKSYDRNFLLFDLSKDSSGFNFIDKVKENDLFGFLKQTESGKDFEKLSNTLMDDILKYNTEDTIEDNPEPIVNFNKPRAFTTSVSDNELEKFLLDETIDNMSNEEINNAMNQIIDKGIKNLTDYDKKMLEKLSNLR
jgi:hypothetical protein